MPERVPRSGSSAAVPELTLREENRRRSTNPLHVVNPFTVFKVAIEQLAQPRDTYMFVENVPLIPLPTVEAQTKASYTDLAAARGRRDARREYFYHLCSDNRAAMANQLAPETRASSFSNTLGATVGGVIASALAAALVMLAASGPVAWAVGAAAVVIGGVGGVIGSRMVQRGRNYNDAKARELHSIFAKHLEIAKRARERGSTEDVNLRSSDSESQDDDEALLMLHMKRMEKTQTDLVLAEIQTRIGEDLQRALPRRTGQRPLMQHARPRSGTERGGSVSTRPQRTADDLAATWPHVPSERSALMPEPAATGATGGRWWWPSELKFTVLSLFGRRSTLDASKPILQPRDGCRVDMQPGCYVDKNEDTGWIEEHVLKVRKEVVVYCGNTFASLKPDDGDRSLPYLDERERHLLAMALRRYRIDEPNGLIGQFRELGCAIVPSDPANLSKTSAEQQAAWLTVRDLARAGAAGAALAARLVSSPSDSDPVELASRLRDVSQAAYALDPEGKETLSELLLRAKRLLGGADGILKRGAGSVQNADGDRQQDALDEQLDGYVPALALVALLDPSYSSTRFLPKISDFALSAIRNGFISNTDLSWACDRVGDLVSHARNLREGRRAERGNPLWELLDPKFRVQPNLIAVQRALRDVNRIMANVFRKMEIPSAYVAAQFALRAALYEYFAERNITRQGLEPTLGPVLRDRIVDKVSNFLHQKGYIKTPSHNPNEQSGDGSANDDVGVRVRKFLGEQLSKSYGEQVGLNRVMLDAWTTVRFLSLAAKRRSVGGESSETDRRIAERYLVKLKVGLLKLEQAVPGMTGNGVTDKPALRARAKVLEEDRRSQAGQSSLRSWKYLRRTYPLEALGSCVEHFELGSSIELSNEKVRGVSVPLALPLALATLGGSELPSFPVTFLGGVKRVRRDNEIVRVALTSNGGEIFVGTKDTREKDVSFGAAVGLKGGGVTIGVGATVGRASARTDVTGVSLRFGRSVGLDGDPAVAGQMSALLCRMQALASDLSIKPNDVLRKLMAEFKELSVSITRDGRQVDSHPDIRHQTLSAGVFAPFIEQGVVMTGVQTKLLSDRNASGHLSESMGHTRVEARARSGTNSTFSTDVNAVSWASGLVKGASLEATRRLAGFCDASSLTIQDGGHGRFSFHTTKFANYDEFYEAVRDPQLLAELVAFEGNNPTLKPPVREAANVGENAEDSQPAEIVSRLLNGVENIKASPGGQYVVFSVIRPQAQKALDWLLSLRNLAEAATHGGDSDNPAGAVGRSAIDVYERIASSRDSFRASYVFKSVEHVEGSEVLWRILRIFGHTRGMRSTAVESAA